METVTQSTTTQGAGNGVKVAEAALEKANDAVKACQDAVAAIETDRAKAQAELAAIEAKEEVSAKEHVTESNLQRRVRKLGEQLEIARAAVIEAEKARDAAAHEVTLAKWDDAVAEHAERARVLVADVQESAARLKEEIDAYHVADVGLRRLGWEVDAVKPRAAPSTLADFAKWNEPPLLAAQKVFEAVAVHNRAAVPDANELARHRPYTPYRPPRDEHGNWNDPTRPEPPADVQGVWGV